MAKSLADLAKKDPEFFKYLKENDAELLDFEGGEDDDEDEDEEEVEAPKKSKKAKVEKKAKGKGKQQEEDEEMMEYDAGSDSDEEPEFGAPEEEEQEVKKVSVSMKMLRSWQRAMIEVSRPERRDVDCPNYIIPAFSNNRCDRCERPSWLSEPLLT